MISIGCVCDFVWILWKLCVMLFDFYRNLCDIVWFLSEFVWFYVISMGMCVILFDWYWNLYDLLLNILDLCMIVCVIFCLIVYDVYRICVWIYINSMGFVYDCMISTEMLYDVVWVLWGFVWLCLNFIGILYGVVWVL